MPAGGCLVVRSLMGPMGRVEVELGQAAVGSSGGVVVEVGSPAERAAVVVEAVLD
jgi:hypothetical protein